MSAGTQFDPELTERFIHAVSARKQANARRGRGPRPRCRRSRDWPRRSRPDAALRLRLEIERLVFAEAEDAAALAKIARELAATAAGDGLPVLADQVSEVGTHRRREPVGHRAQIRKMTDDLLELCRSPETLARAAVQPLGPSCS